MVKITKDQYFQYIAEKSNTLLYEPPNRIINVYSEIISFQLTHTYILEETASVEYLNDLFLRINKLIIYVEFRLSLEVTPIYMYNPMTRTEIVNEFIPYIYFDDECIPEYRALHYKLIRFSDIVAGITNSIVLFNEQLIVHSPILA